jgi:hypothetical protein
MYPGIAAVLQFKARGEPAGFHINADDIAQIRKGHSPRVIVVHKGNQVDLVPGHQRGVRQIDVKRSAVFPAATYLIMASPGFSCI